MYERDVEIYIQQSKVKKKTLALFNNGMVF